MLNRSPDTVVAADRQRKPLAKRRASPKFIILDVERRVVLPRTSQKYFTGSSQLLIDHENVRMTSRVTVPFLRGS